MQNKRKEKNYAFIDGANLHLGVRAQGWRIGLQEIPALFKKQI